MDTSQKMVSFQEPENFSLKLFLLENFLFKKYWLLYMIFVYICVTFWAYMNFIWKFWKTIFTNILLANAFWGIKGRKLEYKNTEIPEGRVESFRSLYLLLC